MVRMSVCIGWSRHGEPQVEGVTEPHGIGRVFVCDWTGGVCDSPCKDVN